MVTLMIIEDKIEELEFLAVLSIDTPVEECPKGVALHKAVEQSAYLLRLPDKLALNRRQHQVVPMDLVECALDGVASLVQRDRLLC